MGLEASLFGDEVDEFDCKSPELAAEERAEREEVLARVARIALLTSAIWAKSLTPGRCSQAKTKRALEAGRPSPSMYSASRLYVKSRRSVFAFISLPNPAIPPGRSRHSPPPPVAGPLWPG